MAPTPYLHRRLRRLRQRLTFYATRARSAAGKTGRAQAHCTALCFNKMPASSLSNAPHLPPCLAAAPVEKARPPAHTEQRISNGTLRAARQALYTSGVLQVCCCPGTLLGPPRSLRPRPQLLDMPSRHTRVSKTSRHLGVGARINVDQYQHTQPSSCDSWLD